MLGPGRPEVDCDECFRLLDQYVEIQLASHDARSRMPQLAAHLDGCPVCLEEAESMLDLLGRDHPCPIAARDARRA
jgi:hypothetical protein